MAKDFWQALVSSGLAAPDALAKYSGRENQSSLVYALWQEGLVEPRAFQDFYARFLDVPLVSLKSFKFPAKLIDTVDADILRKYYALPLSQSGDLLTVAMADPADFEALDALERAAGRRVDAVLAPLEEIIDLLNERYGVLNSVKNIVQNLESAELAPLALGFMENAIFQSSARSGPVNKLLHLIISHALKETASDIHFEPADKDMICRFRIDGVLSKFMTFPEPLANSLASSIKVLAKMDIAEKRLPLDGGFQVKVGSRIIDLRVSSFPVLRGEKIAVRILDKSTVRFSLDGLGLSGRMLELFLPVIAKNNGILLVTGPTGSGKTTTLYAVLNRLRSVEKNIVTIEDPVEYHLDLINQSQVNLKAGLTFARGLRSFLRQDPDILLVGEIRDQETAEIAFQAALTGHLVLSTLHTNDAVSSITRLHDMGIEPYLLSSSIIGVLAQRLVRRVCPDCLAEYLPAPEALSWLGVSTVSHKFYKGQGCAKCRGTGFRGRIGVFELLLPDAELNQLIHESLTSAAALRGLAARKGMITLREDAVGKVLQGLTTAEEAYRVLR
ncbi:MAG: GspE/PulE family protein [Candidatus Margulisbacteria bacterium]|jgi:type IV pilus assembly protein PilB|nr:GspE/PulE family protein [Candidatus Margulisiibacteriota bacterium]